jgi:multiple sugar transport system substrate-binding protein
MAAQDAGVPAVPSIPALACRRCRRNARSSASTLRYGTVRTVVGGGSREIPSYPIRERGLARSLLLRYSRLNKPAARKRAAPEREETQMEKLSRRSLLRAAAGLAAGATLARPYIANAQAKTVEVWWVQGFVPEEDDAFKLTVSDYEKVSGNKVDYSITPFAPHRQKIVSAITSGIVPDLTVANPPEFLPLQAWEGRLLDVTDVVEPYKAKMWPEAVESASCYNKQEKKHGCYGVPYKVAFTPFHIWGSLIEKAGYKVSDIPKKWDEFIDFFPPIQEKLQSMGMRHTYATGFVVSTIGNDPNNTFNQFMLAYGGGNVVGKDGKFNGSSDPQVHEAIVKALEKLTTLFKNGHIPPSSLNWNDADDNNAFHSKLCVMDFDGTLSTELAMLHKQRNEYYHEVITADVPLSNEGKTIPRQIGVAEMIIPKGAKNVPVAKEFAKYMIEPEVNVKNVKGGLGRYLPVMPDLVKNDPWWTDTKRDPHVPPYVKIGMGGAPLVQYFFTYNPAWAKVRSEHPFNIAFHDVVAEGAKPKDAAEKAVKRIEEIFAGYKIET